MDNGKCNINGSKALLLNSPFVLTIKYVDMRLLEWHKWLSLKGTLK